MRRRPLLFALAALLILVLCYVGYNSFFRPTYVTVLIVNNSKQPLREVRLHFSGRSQSVDLVEANASKTIFLSPGRDSGLVIDFLCKDGATKSENLGGYFSLGIGCRYIVFVCSNGEIHSFFEYE